MLSHSHRVLRSSAVLLFVGTLVSACGTDIIYGDPGGTSVGGNTGGNNTGGNNTGGNNTGGNNTGGNNTGGGGNNTGGNNTGGGGNNGIDCVTAENFDPCDSPGSYCSYYDAGTGEQCDAWCSDQLFWEKSCYTEPTYCFQPPNLCPSSVPVNGTYCANTPECEYYECEVSGACGGTTTTYAQCQNNQWFVNQDCYCFQPPNLCPSAPPQLGSPCATTAQCQQYECQWQDACGANTFHFGYCDGGTWFTDGDCNP